MAKKFLTPTGLVSLTSDPANGSEGQLYFNNTEDVVKIYRNGSWTNLTTTEEIQDAASSLLDHSNHVNIEATYNDNSNQIILEADLSSAGATGYYGSFYHSSSAIVSASATTQEVAIPINTTAEANGVSVENNISGKPTRIKFANAGVYNIQFSVQLANSNNTVHNATIWLKKNGTNVPSSSGQVTVPEKHGGINGQIIQAWNYVMSLAANDFIEFYFQVEHIGIFIETIPAGTTPTIPESPAIIITAQQITNTLAPGFGGSGSSFYLNDLLDVSIITPENHQLVAFNQETGLWKNLHPAEIDLATTSNLSNAIVTASAAAVSSASANTVSQINALTTSDIEEGSRLYFTNQRSLTTASTALVHGNHTNITAAYNSASNQIILTGTAGGGGAISVSSSAPLSPNEGDGWFDNTDGKFYVYDGSFWVESAPTDAAYASYNRWTKVLSGSASMITGLGDNGVTLDYTPGQESVYINGIFIDRESYTASSGSAISFDEIVFSGDVIEIVWLDNIAIVDITNIYTKTEQDNLFLTKVSASNTYTTLTQFNNIDLTSAINTASAAAYASASAYTNSQLAIIDLSSTIQTASAAAVNYLIDSAPGTLDTLNELSAALNDDPNFYSTIASVYLTQSNASATYLSQSSASTTYEKLIPYSTSTPTSPVTGDMWVDSNTVPPALKVYTGSAWVQLGAAVDDSQAIIAGRMFA